MWRSVTELWPVPKRDELKVLPMRHKDNPAGPVAWVVFLLLRMMRKLGSAWAKNTYERFVQNIGDVVYYVDNTPSKSLQGHESIHTFQRETLGTIRYLWRYYSGRKGRRHAEAMAYAYETVAHGRDPEERARAAADPVYMLGWDASEARELLDAYADKFRKEWRL